MKNVSSKVIPLLKSGYCAPTLSRLAKRLKEPSTTLQYNIKKLEGEGAIKAYKAVFDYRKIDEGFCAYTLIKLSPDEYGNPERIGEALVKHSEIESIDMITGESEMILKIHVKDQEAYYNFVRNVISRKGIIKISSLVSLKQLKTEFVEVV